MLDSVRRIVFRFPWLRSALSPVVRFIRRLYALSLLPLEAGALLVLWINSRTPGVGTHATGRLIAMTVVSDLRADPRVEREARALARAGYEVVVIWPDTRDPAKNEPELDWGPRISFAGLRWQAGAFAYRFPGFLGFEMVKAALVYRPFAFHAHDLTTALVALIAGRRTGAHVVCDFHEWYSENVTWSASRGRYVPHPWPVRTAYQWLERLVFRHASGIITVCDSLAREMEGALGDGTRCVRVVRNIPDIGSVPTRVYRPLKKELGLAPDAFVLLYQGGVGPSRMIESIIETLTVAKQCHFVIRGPGVQSYGEGYRQLARRIGVEDRVFILPPVPSGDVVAAAMGADAGIWTLPNLCKNFYYALPNKIFEYLAAGLPVLAADYPEASKLVRGGGVGLCFNPYDPPSIAHCIETLAQNPALANAMRTRIPTLLGELSAEDEWQKLVGIYDELLRKPEIASRLPLVSGAS